MWIMITTDFRLQVSDHVIACGYWSASGGPQLQYLLLVACVTPISMYSPRRPIDFPKAFKLRRASANKVEQKVDAGVEK